MLFFDTKIGEQVRERRALQDALRAAIECRRLRLTISRKRRCPGRPSDLKRWRAGGSASWLGVARRIHCHRRRKRVGRSAGRMGFARGLPRSRELAPASDRRGEYLAAAIPIRGSPDPCAFDSARHRLAPSRLELEITENVFIDDFYRAISILSRLKALGVRVAWMTSGPDILPCRTCILSHSTKSRSIGLRSRSRAQSAFHGDRARRDRSRPQPRHSGTGRRRRNRRAARDVARWGCDEVQGYLVGRPMPIDDYADLVEPKMLAQDLDSQLA